MKKSLLALPLAALAIMPAAASAHSLYMPERTGQQAIRAYGQRIAESAGIPADVSVWGCSRARNTGGALFCFVELDTSDVSCTEDVAAYWPNRSARYVRITTPRSGFDCQSSNGFDLAP